MDSTRPPDGQDDEVIKEVRRARQQMLAESGGTLEGLFKLLKELETKETLPVVNRPPRKLSASDKARAS